jgi:hypothetical protein
MVPIANFCHHKAVAPGYLNIKHSHRFFDGLLFVDSLNGPKMFRTVPEHVHLPTGHRCTFFITNHLAKCGTILALTMLTRQIGSLTRQGGSARSISQPPRCSG